MEMQQCVLFRITELHILMTGWPCIVV